MVRCGAFFAPWRYLLHLWAVLRPLWAVLRSVVVSLRLWVIVGSVGRVPSLGGLWVICGNSTGGGDPPGSTTPGGNGGGRGVAYLPPFSDSKEKRHRKAE